MADGEVAIYQLKITLAGSDPLIWRRVLVRADTTLEVLNFVILHAMGWLGYHMHQFITGSRASTVYYGSQDPDFPDMDMEMLDESDYTVADIAPTAKGKFFYEYDFGDGWGHNIVVEKILPPDPAFKHPVCLDGRNACPMEDSGGIEGYYGILEILEDPKHPEYEETFEWAGGKWDATKFRIENVNSKLKKIQS